MLSIVNYYSWLVIYIVYENNYVVGYNKKIILVILKIIRESNGNFCKFYIIVLREFIFLFCCESILMENFEIYDYIIF